ncbi:SMU1112c/YaeR family gloxylase I-like metalloprotein [Gemella sanguinis]|jgi:glyoxylase family protein|uniref:VOC family protein n=1 Tax=Gemella sanguinis TaxID=84135 RepID=A0A2N6SD24_9BACL|nr:VOC family protein [Gemella sanguinis]PMC51830.1 VOC family protein [Gemella sanguinis]
MKLSKIHHIAIIGTDYNKTTDFYINKLKFEKISEYNRPEKNDILLNVKKGDIVLEIFIKKDAPLRPPMPSPEYTGLRHLAFRVDSVEDILEEFDKLDIVHEGLRYDDYDGKKMAFFFDPDGLPLEIHE